MDRNKHVAFVSLFLIAQALQEMYECIMWFTTKAGFHKKLIKSQKHIAQSVLKYWSALPTASQEEFRFLISQII